MKCLACGRSLLKFAFSIKTAEGVRGWGPKCAKSVEIVPTRTSYPVARQRQAVTRVATLPADPRQMPIDFEAAA